MRCSGRSSRRQGYVGPCPAGRFWTGQRGVGRTEQDEGLWTAMPGAGGLLGDQAAEEEGLWRYLSCCRRKSLRQNESSLNV